MNTDKVVKELGRVKDEIRGLKGRAEELEALLIEAASEEGGATVRFKGGDWTATVYFADRRVTDWSDAYWALVEASGFDEAKAKRIVESFTRISESEPRVRVAR